MAEDGLLHTTEMLKTALPYVNARTRLTLDLLLKLFELMVSMYNFRTNDITACGFDENEEADMETLLNKIRPKCNKQEGSFVDQLLSVFKAKKMFEMYNSYMDVMNTMQGFEGFGGLGGFEGGMDNDFVSNFMNNFSNFDLSGIDLSSIFAGKDQDIYNDESDFDNTSTYNTSDYEDTSDKDDKLSSDENNTSDKNDRLSSDENNEDYDNEKMFESLKAMIPPDQMGAYENLRMLFGSPSYDDNSKSD